MVNVLKKILNSDIKKYTNHANSPSNQSRIDLSYFQCLKTALSLKSLKAMLKICFMSSNSNYQFSEKVPLSYSKI